MMNRSYASEGVRSFSLRSEGRCTHHLGRIRPGGRDGKDVSIGRVSGPGGSGGWRTYPRNTQQLDLAVGEDEGRAGLALALELLEVRLVDDRAIGVRWGIMPGSGLGGHGGRRSDGEPRKKLGLLRGGSVAL